ncbi:Zn-ribbon domain-containing OB-fold protein [Williamsia soli]|uniref:Zn-ribbon domain-containing OB-fold protein n=1 Tax=Williamsia soli TaxID=364929 RepID=UPI001A9F1169|nr:OB-fold domain-containing protein [Williamsia soli]
MSADRPLPGDVVDDAIDQPFWDACNDSVLLVYRCNTCGTSYWPAGSCTTHGMSDMGWVPAAGTGQLHTWTVVHQRYSRSFTDDDKIVAVIKLDEGPFFHTNLIDTHADDLKVGLPVKVTFSTGDDGVALPMFRLSGPPQQ